MLGIKLVANFRANHFDAMLFEYVQQARASSVRYPSIKRLRHARCSSVSLPRHASCCRRQATYREPAWTAVVLASRRSLSDRLRAFSASAKARIKRSLNSSRSASQRLISQLFISRSLPSSLANSRLCAFAGHPKSRCSLDSAIFHL